MRWIFKHFPFIPLAFILAISCQKEVKESLAGSKDFYGIIIDMAIEQKSNIPIELPEIYDSLATKLPNDGDETIILAQKLKQRGFKVIDWGRGNYPPKGPRIINLILQKENCVCEVRKMYHYSIIDTLYEMSESIKCMDSSSYYQKIKSDR
jgi:hypothetical protein